MLPSSLPVSGEDVSGVDVSVEDVSGEDVSGEDVSGEDVSGEDVSGEDVSGEAVVRLLICYTHSLWIYTHACILIVDNIKETDRDTV